jgi:hypothetical protein
VWRWEDTEKDLHEAIADRKKDLHKELSVGTQGTQIEIEIT